MDGNLLEENIDYTINGSIFTFKRKIKNGVSIVVHNTYESKPNRKGRRDIKYKRII